MPWQIFGPSGYLGTIKSQKVAAGLKKLAAKNPKDGISLKYKRAKKKQNV